MKYLFYFEIEPKHKILGFIPIKVALIIIAIIATFFGVINFIGLLNFAGHEKDPNYYVIQTLGFFSPLILIYTAFKRDYLTAYIAIYFHTIYLFVITLVSIFAFSLFMIFGLFDETEGSSLVTSFIVQAIYTSFLYYGNYVFTCFYNIYDDVVLETSAPNAPNKENLVNA
jgi:hypothetical protein